MVSVDEYRVQIDIHVNKNFFSEGFTVLCFFQFGYINVKCCIKIIYIMPVWYKVTIYIDSLINSTRVIIIKLLRRTTYAVTMDAS